MSFYQERINPVLPNRINQLNQGYFFPTFYLGSGMLQAWFGHNSTYYDPNIKFRDEIINLPNNANIGLRN